MMKLVMMKLAMTKMGTSGESGMMPRAMGKMAILALPLALPLALSGCISLGSEPPESLLTLTAESTAPAGSATSATRASAIAINEPGVTAELDVLRVPVQVDDTEIAYLQDAVWVEKPARLFRRVLAETVRAQSGAFVIDGDDPALFADQRLRGTLRNFGYDARRSAVVVRFDAIREGENRSVEMRRFEAVEPGIAPEVGAVGPALNRAANDVARQVAEWMGGA